ncbi:alpha/beta hydrolase family protein [Amycolatopsis dendrobii]|uniref:Alpha/beta hydrolase n=1 Tax=Amycolatopsis dendrobii TaxID=2760662 RepID=A0A7W3ZDX7_9PSEU|nr:alpha/beta hydrolase [Amycolatopsis dendrobii]MBB1157334.1 alpha/beta hydrolase [Amycolatopsis dendrobii]
MLPWGKSRLAAAILVLGSVLPTAQPVQAQPSAEVSFAGAGGITLHGTVFRPDGPAKSAIVLQGGSDWRTRDNLRVQAEMFTRLGVTTLVYDRRASGYSKTQRDYGVLADDLVSAVRALRARSGAAEVGVWGVSEGAWVAPLAATRAPDISYVITVGGSGWGGARQTSWYWGNVLRHQGISGSLLRTLPVQGTRFAVGSGLFPEAGYDPVPVLRGLKQPILALWGDLDINHVPVESSRIFADALAGHPNHTIRFVAGGGPDLYATSDAGFDRLPRVVPGYPAAVAEWLADRRGGHVETAAFTQRPTEALRPLSWWESVWAQGIALALLLGGFAVGGVVALMRRRGTRSSRWLAGLGTATVAGFVGMLGWAQLSGMKDLGPVFLGRPLPWLAVQALAVATVVALAVTATGLRNPGRRRGAVAPLVAGLVFVPWAVYWGLLLP